MKRLSKEIQMTGRLLLLALTLLAIEGAHACIAIKNCDGGGQVSCNTGQGGCNVGHNYVECGTGWFVDPKYYVKVVCRGGRYGAVENEEKPKVLVTSPEGYSFSVETRPDEQDI